MSRRAIEEIAESIDDTLYQSLTANNDSTLTGFVDDDRVSLTEAVLAVAHQLSRIADAMEWISAAETARTGGQ